MKDNLYVSIAKKYDISKTTVSKAARHCGGVDTETRQLILDELKTINHSVPGHKNIYCILPDIPRYFWHEMHLGIIENCSADISYKMNLYTKLSDEATILTYLEEAEQARPHVLIIAAVLTDPIRSKLKKMMKHTCVLLLSEFGNMVNTFYIGADSYDDGYHFGLMYNTKYTADKIIILTEDNNSQLRAKGFMDALGKPEQSFIRLPLTEVYVQKHAVSTLAKMISPYKDTANCIYSTFGNPSLPLAAKKAGFTDSTVILAHDTFSQDGSAALPDGFSAVINQDVYSQGKAAVEAAEFFVRTMRYPVQKNTHIPSVILHTEL